MPQVVEQLEGAVDHVLGPRGDLGAAAEAGEVVASVAIVLLDSGGQILSREELILGNEAVEALPVVGQEDVALGADLVEKSVAGRIITPTRETALLFHPEARARRATGS